MNRARRTDIDVTDIVLTGADGVGAPLASFAGTRVLVLTRHRH